MWTLSFRHQTAPVMKRRNFLRRTGAGSALLLSGLPALSLARSEHDAERSSHPSGEPDVELALYAFPSKQSLLPGAPTRTMTFRGEILRGDPSHLSTLGSCFFGPTLRFHRGERVRIHFHNRLDKPTIVHWHGMHIPEAADGHPRLAIEPGATYVYDFTVDNRAGSYWYHTHPHGRTGEEVNHGLCGLLLITDDEEDALPLPRGPYDLPIVLQDRAFDEENQLVLGEFGMGDCMLVNGAFEKRFSVSSRPYRLRLMNLSNDRFFKLGWNDGRPLTVIGVGGGLLERPLAKAYVMLGPAERIDVWADFSDDPVGTELEMLSLPFLTGPGTGLSNRLWVANFEGLMDLFQRADEGEELPEWKGFPLFKLGVDREERVELPLPERLCTIPRIPATEAVNHDAPKPFHFAVEEIEDGFRFGINGREFEMTATTPDEVVRLNTTEIWNLSSAGFHTAHIHGLQFQILERALVADADEVILRDWETVKDGFIDEGWHDTVAMFPGTRTRVIMRFEDHTGLYLYHCHNLHHEDAGMMRNYRVIA